MKHLLVLLLDIDIKKQEEPCFVSKPKQNHFKVTSKHNKSYQTLIFFFVNKGSSKLYYYVQASSTIVYFRTILYICSKFINHTYNLISLSYNHNSTIMHLMYMFLL